MPPEQYFRYFVAVNITGDRAANLDLCLELLEVRVHVRVTPATTRDFGLYGLI
jgi:hypothetical protein